MSLPFNEYKFGQFASYYDQMRACVKYFVEERGKKKVGAIYQDTDYGRDVLAGAVAQLDKMGMKMVATAADKPTDTDFDATIAKLRDAGCDLVVMGTIVRDTIIPLQTARQIGWKDVDFCGNFATYSTAVVEAPGGPAEGFYSMSPAVYRYPDNPSPDVRAFAERYKKAWGMEPTISARRDTRRWSSRHLAALEKAGRNLTLDSFIAGLESMKDWEDISVGRRFR